MKLVSETSDADLRKREASEEFDATLKAAAINLLRVIAGAGSPAEVLPELHRCVAATAAYREAHNEYPTAHHIASLLDAKKYDADEHEAWSPEHRMRWDANGETMRIYAALSIRTASLRVVAGQWAGHRTVLINAETAFVKALNQYIQATDFYRRNGRREKL